MSDKIIAKNLSIGYGENVIIKNADFMVKDNDIFIIMGASGCGKSTLLKVLTGLMPPISGEFFIDNINYTNADNDTKLKIIKKIGILYQSGGLFSSMTLAENVALPLQKYSTYSLARALALDPEVLFFDEPSAGLDPLSSARLDELMLNINQNLKTTLVVVTHELSSIFTIGSNSIFLDAETKTINAQGKPADLLKNPPNKNVYNFLTRGKFNEKRT